MSVEIRKAMVLAGGRGERMQPLTNDRPKPLVEVGGRALIDRAIDHLLAAGVDEIVVNVHYMADMLEAHLKARSGPRIEISDERDQLLDTGGGVKRALPMLGSEPFFVVNSDALWIEEPGAKSNIASMMEAYDAEGSDYLMLVTETQRATGYTGQGDFDMDEKANLAWRQKDQFGPFMFAGVQIMNEKLFDNAPDDPFSNSWVWNNVLIPQHRFVGYMLTGSWLHASSAEDVAAINEVLRDAPK